MAEDTKINIRQLYETGATKDQITDEYGLVVRKVEGTDEVTKVIKQEKL